MSNDRNGRFSFIDDKILRQNLNQVFDDIVDFTSIMDSFTEESIRINFRRAVIIYTSAIIEALMHYIVERKVKPLEFEDDMWSYVGNPYICHNYVDDEKREIQIICGKRFKKKKKITRNTQFKQINKVALDQKLITPTLFELVEEIRCLRNRIHLASLENIEKKYSKPVLNRVFDTARKIVKLAQKYS